MMFAMIYLKLCLVVLRLPVLHSQVMTKEGGGQAIKQHLGRFRAHIGVRPLGMGLGTAGLLTLRNRTLLVR